MTETLKETSYHQPLVGLGQEGANLAQGEAKRFGLKMKNTSTFIEDENNNQVEKSIDSKKLHKAVQFKYRSNATKADIEAIRRLLQVQRTQQLFNEDEWNFFANDYNRMMIDDWLITRFLLRGKKANFLRATLDTQVAQDDEAIYARTMELIEMCARFRYEYRVNGQTRESDFPTDWTTVNGMFHHEHDRADNPVAYLRVSSHRPKLIESNVLRHKFYSYMLYMLEQCDQELFQKPGKAICCVFDLSNVAYENIDLELTTWMIKSFKNCAPKLLCYVIIYNPPWFFAATFKLICSTLLSNNKRHSIKFAHGDEILDYIEYEKLPPYLKLRLSEAKK